MPAPDSTIPADIAALPPAALPLSESMSEEVKHEVARRASDAGGADLSALGDVAELVVDVVGTGAAETGIEAAAAALEVGGEVVGGALEALGSGLEVAGGCAEGCSLIIAAVVLLAATGGVLALGVF
jgi:hypothetical protein